MPLAGFSHPLRFSGGLFSLSSFGGESRREKAFIFSISAASQRHRQNFRLQPLPIARVTKTRVHESFQPILREFTFALLIKPLQIRNHALERSRNFAHLARAPKR